MGAVFSCETNVSVGKLVKYVIKTETLNNALANIANENIVRVNTVRRHDNLKIFL
jgi:hypothetical protein